MLWIVGIACLSAGLLAGFFAGLVFGIRTTVDDVRDAIEPRR